MATQEMLFVTWMISATLLQVTSGQSGFSRAREIPAPVPQAERNQPLIPAYIQNADYSDQGQYLAGAYQSQGKYAPGYDPAQYVRPIPTQGRPSRPKQSEYKIPAKPATPVYRPESGEQKRNPSHRPAEASSSPPSGYTNVANIVFAGLPEGAFDGADHEYATYHGHPEAQGFGYAVDDNDNGNKFTHNGYSEGDTTKGEYRVLLPDGRTQIVTYSSDPERGYMARVTYEGTARPYTPPQAEKYDSFRNEP
nr:pro-resilin-like [Penaeus vannamei]